MSYQLLVTFSKPENLEETVESVFHTHEIFRDRVFILKSSSIPEYILCYNLVERAPKLLKNTISVHRKKHTNTIYTINALNELVKYSTGGYLDKEFKINWEGYRNTLLITDESALIEIPTKIHLIETKK